MVRLNFERSTTTQALIIALRGVNDEISYEALAGQIEVSIPRMKASLVSARRILTDEEIHFGVIQGYGLRRLGSIHLATKQPANIKKLGRAVSRNEKEIKAIKEFEKLPLDNQRMVTTARLVYENFKISLKTKPKPEPPTISRGELPK